MQSVHISLGNIRMELGDFEGALHYYSTALEYYPLDEEASITMGIAYEKLGGYGEALRDYQFILSRQEDYNISESTRMQKKRVRELSRI